jgi:hypothetical protein
VATHLAIFVENKPGKMECVTQVLKEAEINLRGITIASQGDYGVIKILPDNPDKAYQILKEHHFTVTKKPVILVKVPDNPGALHDMLAILNTHSLNVDGCYGILIEECKDALIVLEVDNISHCEQVLKGHKYKLFSDDQVHSL